MDSSVKDNPLTRGNPTALPPRCGNAYGHRCLTWAAPGTREGPGEEETRSLCGEEGNGK